MIAEEEVNWGQTSEARGSFQLPRKWEERPALIGTGGTEWEGVAARSTSEHIKATSQPRLYPRGPTLRPGAWSWLEMPSLPLLVTWVRKKQGASGGGILEEASYRPT